MNESNGQCNNWQVLEESSKTTNIWLEMRKLDTETNEMKRAMELIEISSEQNGRCLSSATNSFIVAQILDQP